MVIQRVITGLLIATFAGVIIWFGEPWFTIVACVVSILATLEFYRMVKKEYTEPLIYLGLLFSILFILNAHSPYPFSYPLLFAAITIIPLIRILFKKDKEHAFDSWGWTVAGVLYIGWMLSFYIQIRSMEMGKWWIFLILSCTALGDVFAFTVGSIMGKHLLAPSISPGKTWEGAIGGMCASIIFALILGTWFQLPLNYWQLIITGLIITAFSQTGDLVESLLKRNMKTKDAGHLLPGHGGILDRIDSHLLIAPVSYFLITLINNQG